MIPKETKKEFVGVCNLYKRMNIREKELLQEVIREMGITPASKRNYGKTITREEWNEIVRPALIERASEATDFYPDHIREVRIVIKIDSSRHTAQSDTYVREDGAEKHNWTMQELVSTARALIRTGEQILERASAELINN